MTPHTISKLQVIPGHQGLDVIESDNTQITAQVQGAAAAASEGQVGSSRTADERPLAVPPKTGSFLQCFACIGGSDKDEKYAKGYTQMRVSGQHSRQ